MIQRRVFLRAGGSLLAVGLALGACGDDDTIEPASVTSTTVEPDAGSTTAAPDQGSTTSASGSPVADGSGCTPGPGTLPDGRWFGIVEDASALELSFDLACWFSGDQAELAAAEDGTDVSNDYHVRNSDPTLRTIPVAPESSVVWYPSGYPDDHPTVAYGEWLSGRETRDHQLAVWIEVEHGTVIAIEEQWVP